MISVLLLYVLSFFIGWSVRGVVEKDLYRTEKEKADFYSKRWGELVETTGRRIALEEEKNHPEAPHNV